MENFVDVENLSNEELSIDIEIENITYRNK